MTVTSITSTVTTLTEPVADRNSPSTFASRANTNFTELNTVLGSINTVLGEINVSIDDMNALGADLVAANLPDLTGQGDKILIVASDEAGADFANGLHWDNTTGGLGIGTSSPENAFHLFSSVGPQAIFETQVNNGNDAEIVFRKSRLLGAALSTDLTGTIRFQGHDGTGFVDSAVIYANNASDLVLRADHVLVRDLSNSEVARFTDTGDFLVGTTVDDPGVDNTDTGIALAGSINSSRDANVAAIFNRNTSDGPIVQFRRQGNVVGRIEVTTTATSYNTTSARWLKENIVSLDYDPGQKIDAVSPRSFDWINTGEHAHGFIADEFAQAFPSSVTYDDDGQAEAIDASTPEVMATIIAELQSLRRRVADLEGRHT